MVWILSEISQFVNTLLSKLFKKLIKLIVLQCLIKITFKQKNDILSVPNNY